MSKREGGGTAEQVALAVVYALTPLAMFVLGFWHACRGRR